MRRFTQKDPKGPKGTQKEPKRTQKDPKGTQKDPKGPKRNPEELKTDFSYMIKVLVLFKKKTKYKSRMTQRLIFGHLFFYSSPQMLLYIYIHQPYLIYRFSHVMKYM